MNFCLHFALLIGGGLAAVGHADPTVNEWVMLDMIQNNPGDPVGWQQTKYANPTVAKNLHYTGRVPTGELSLTLSASFGSLGDFFPSNSSSRAWLDAFRSGQKALQTRSDRLQMPLYYFVDLMVFPTTLIEHFKADILDSNGNVQFNNKTRQLMQMQFDEAFALLPTAAGIVVRTGETYVFDTPYHKGNSPTKDVPSSQHNALWTQFISFLRDTVCVRHNKKVFFRSWDNWSSSASTYAAISDPIETHPLLYFSIKHTPGDFFRTTSFNEQLGTGKHAQIIEVECQREYEGKGAHPDYVMDGVINGFSEMNPKVGISSVVHKPQIRGLWTWSRGGGWWGPYIHGHELWVDVNVYVISQWFLKNGTRDETLVFADWCHEYFGTEDTAFCGAVRKIALRSADAVLYGHYCPSAGSAKGGCLTGTMRDDRLGGLHQLSGVFSEAAGSATGTAVLLKNKRSAPGMFLEMAQTYETEIAAKIVDEDTRAFFNSSLWYGVHLFSIIAEGWTVMAHGYAHDHNLPFYNHSALVEAISHYDQEWASFKAYGLADYYAPSLYFGYYFNEPGQTPQPGLDDSVNQYRNLI